MLVPSALIGVSRAVCSNCVAALIGLDAGDGAVGGDGEGKGATTEFVKASHPIAVWAKDLATRTLSGKGTAEAPIDKDLWASPIKRVPDAMIWGIEDPAVWHCMDDEVLFLFYDAFWPGQRIVCPFCKMRCALATPVHPPYPTVTLLATL